MKKVLGIILVVLMFAPSAFSQKATQIVDVWVGGTMPGNAASEPESEMPAKGLPFIHIF